MTPGSVAVLHVVYLAVSALGALSQQASAEASHILVFCVQDPGNPHYFLAKTREEAGWSQGDECFAQGGGATLYGNKPCIGGSGLEACLSAAGQAGLKASPLPAYCVQDPGNPHYFLAKTREEAGWSQGDECFAQGGGVTLYGDKPCIGGSGLEACLSAAGQAGLNASSGPSSGVQDPGNPQHFLAKLP